MNSLFCKHCGMAIRREYVDAAGAFWHPEHFLCCLCRKPIDQEEFTLVEDRPCHSSCYLTKVAPKCACCGKGLVGQYSIDFWENNYCLDCAKTHPSCRYCSRLICKSAKTAAAQTIDLRTCTVCESSALHSLGDARSEFSFMIDWVKRKGVPLKWTFTGSELELCDQAFLDRDSNRQHDEHHLGITRIQSVTGSFVQKTSVRVSILSGLPRKLFRGVAAHELGHVWLGLAGMPAWSPIETEGFCELISFLWFEEDRSQEARYYAEGIKNSKDRIYGDGFRQIRKVCDRYSFGVLIKSIQTNRRIPS